MREFVDHHLQTKGHVDVSEYFQGLLREAQEEQAEKRLEALLLESLDDPRPDIQITPEFWEGTRKRAAQRVKQLKRRTIT